MHAAAKEPSAGAAGWPAEEVPVAELQVTQVVLGDPALRRSFVVAARVPLVLGDLVRWLEPRLDAVTPRLEIRLATIGPYGWSARVEAGGTWHVAEAGWVDRLLGAPKAKAAAAPSRSARSRTAR